MGVRLDVDLNLSLRRILAERIELLGLENRGRQGCLVGLELARLRCLRLRLEIVERF